MHIVEAPQVDDKLGQCQEEESKSDELLNCMFSANIAMGRTWERLTALR